MCDLRVRIEGSVLEDRIAQLHRELAARKLRFRPFFWLSDEWFTPDRVPGIAIPFYLAHPRLMRLERRQMLEVEGGTREWCMRILRHETGHALDNAYQLRRRGRRRQLFGRPSKRYPEHYLPKPDSRGYVLHLDSWYAQSHPDEDFAETFAVWLQPRSQWRKRYENWPALSKLEYMDELMRQIARRRPPVKGGAPVEPLAHIRKTLREHYRQKRQRYATDYPDFYDNDLRRLFSDASEARDGQAASAFIRRVRSEVRRNVSRWTGEHQYTIDQVLQDMDWRCRELNLRARGPLRQLKLGLTILLTVQTMNFRHGGRHRIVI